MIYFDEGEMVYGAVKIQRCLEEKLKLLQHNCSVKRVQKIMRKLHLRSITRGNGIIWGLKIKVDDKSNLLK